VPVNGIYQILTSRMNSKIEMSEFKKIFYMEWAHRIGGRMLGLT
jgi:heme A synthase